MAWTAIGLAAVGALVLGSAGIGYRIGAWGLRPALAILQGSVVIAGAALLLALVAVAVAGAARSWPAVAVAALAALVALGTAAVPLQMRRTARALPFIHDVTTDTAEPPAFVVLREARERAPNGEAYGGPAVARLQEQGYSDLGPARLSAPPDLALAKAEAAARALGWRIAAVAPADGRLEATDTSRWFGFEDDIVVRVRAAPRGSLVDVRSASRVGQSDLGVNARRIRAFLAALAAG